MLEKEIATQMINVREHQFVAKIIVLEVILDGMMIVVLSLMRRINKSVMQVARNYQIILEY